MTLLIATMADAASEAGGSTLPQLETWHYPSQIFWTIILFGAMYFALSRFILPKLGGVIEFRESSIANDLDEASRLSEQAEAAQKALEVRMAEARNKARETADKARAKIDAEIAEETNAVDTDLAEKLEAAEARISALRADAMSNVDSIAADALQTITDRFNVSTSSADAKSAITKTLGS